ncbi:type IV pilin N-terminal domain-containing protein [Haloarcula sp. S1CR25-12]|uniref:Type IV pilin N-terminal domain-containing protein n=1 Tax=Haloarcula saliterrae TaxID=2950534 RepID=A0ABU2F7Y1_9EURY|nr:type IV pilin N-terminal domain-containing protein [Haloarcula sp. S1CR25-12]MDS0258311.1 type IV pilin N-terminal domain-containing protein [Haloarcula sp. S1CR25-12]
MQLKQLLNDDDAVSPVIGVILMVAITVILAAVIATFVLGLGDSLSNQAPQATFTFDSNNDPGGTTTDTVNITHDGGDDVAPSNVQIKIGGADFVNADGTDYKSGQVTASRSIFPSDPVSAGDTFVIAESSDSIQDGDSIRVIWSDSDGGSSAVLSESTVNL